MSEETSTILRLAFQYGGWAIAAAMSWFLFQQKMRIKSLELQIKSLKSNEIRLEQHMKLLNESLQDVVTIISDERITVVNKKKLDKTFGDLSKPWTDED